MMNYQLSMEDFNKMLPETFSIETALACDLKCPECAIGGDAIVREKGFCPLNNLKLLRIKSVPMPGIFISIYGVNPC